MKWLNVIFLILLFAVPSFAEDNITLPEGWRYPTAEQLYDELIRCKSQTKYAKAVVDFNGDGIDDQAYLLKS